MELSKYKDIVYEIIGSAMAVHHEFGSGLLEPIYQEALSLELLMHGLSNQREEELSCKIPKKGAIESSYFYFPA